jgi:hypothetical protein
MELAEFRRWFVEFDGNAWDRQIEQDASSGKLDQLAAEALADYSVGSARHLWVWSTPHQSGSGSALMLYPLKFKPWRSETSLSSRPIQVIRHCISRLLQMVDFIAPVSASTIAHLASPYQAAYIGFGSGRMANMTSSSANKLLVANTQQRDAASRRLLCAGRCQR